MIGLCLIGLLGFGLGFLVAAWAVGWRAEEYDYINGKWVKRK